MITNKQIGILLGTIFATSTLKDERYDTVVTLLDQLVSGKMSDKERSEAIAEMINSTLDVIVGEPSKRMIILETLCDMLKSTCATIVTRPEINEDWSRALSNTLGQTVAELQSIVTSPTEQIEEPAHAPRAVVKKTPISVDKVWN